MFSLESVIKTSKIFPIVTCFLLKRTSQDRGWDLTSQRGAWLVTTATVVAPQSGAVTSQRRRKDKPRLERVSGNDVGGDHRKTRTSRS